MSLPFSEDPFDPLSSQLKLFASEAMELRATLYGIQDELCYVGESLVQMIDTLDEYLDDDPWPRADDQIEAPPPEDPVDYNSVPF